jgi:hypothetical protein
MFTVRNLSTIFAALVACAILAPAAQAVNWTVVPGTAATTSSQLSGASCTTTSSCILVGLQSGTTTRALATRFNGSTFSPLTAASTTSELYGVGCTTATFCVAVGANFASGTVPHAETFNGTTWSNTTTTNPAGATSAQLARVACPASTTCFAAGSFQTAVTTMPMVQRWNGSGWTLQSLTLPAGATSSSLSGIACNTTTTCTAVGYYESAGNPRRTMVLRWNGTAWSSQTGVNQAGATLSELQGVACTSGTSCNAVGDYLDATGVGHSLAQIWNGTTWTLKTVPDPAGGTDAALSDISCYTSPSAGCAAVGGYSGVGNIEPMAASWNGTAWTLKTVPKPSGATDATLSGVSCPTTCVADGLSNDVNGLHPLVVTGQ